MRSRMFRPGILGALAVGSVAIATGTTVVGCLDRPIAVGEPNSTSTIVELLPNSGVGKIDLILGIDNSASMADKQQILAQAVPDLVERLVNPRCIDASGQPIDVQNQPAGPEAGCPAGSRREFPPVLDVHIGIVTSSLGGHGGNICPDQQDDAVCGLVSQNDRGELVARKNACSLKNDLPTYEGKGFLSWDPMQAQNPPGEKRLGKLDGSEPGLIPTFAEMVQGTGQRGCGYESQLESIYRFLVDPEPYKSISVNNGEAVMEGVDTDLLAQREAFLRPDSLVAVLMLSDENDCSMTEGGANFAAARSTPLPRPRAICAENPQDPCCASCSGKVPAGCPDDPTCFDENHHLRFLSADEDNINLRCFDQKRRFGYDFLYPIDRYSQAFTKTEITNRAGEVVRNPLFPKANRETGLVAPREPGMVFIAGIVGVPWQDIARNPKDLSAGFKTSDEMREDDTWKIILGEASNGQLPLDPLMRESILPRVGVNPVLGEPTDVTPSTPLGNSINGNERDTKGMDLQYACIFDLPEPQSCATDSSCDCFASGTDNPLCDSNGSKTLVRAKAYPGLRQLELLHDLGDQGIVASVCPEQATDLTRDNYGYRAAIGALVDRLKEKINGPCLPRTLTRDSAGNVNCLLLEARNTGGKCDCNSVPARMDVDPKHEPAVQLAQERAPGNDWDCFCEIPQLRGEEELALCQNELSDSLVTSSGDSVDGYCYIDATTEPTVGNPVLVASCPENERRQIRLVGKAVPANDATLIALCSAEF